MSKNINWKKIGLYLLVSFGISWLVGSLMSLLDIGLNTPHGVAIVGVFYMGGPAIATFVIQKFIFKEGFKQYGWTFNRKAIKWVLLTPLLFLTFILLTFLIIGLFGNTHLINEFGQVHLSRESFLQQYSYIFSSRFPMENIELPSLPSIPSIPLFMLLLAGSMILGITLNLPFMFGEEFGWRGLLLKETQPMGFAGSSLFIGTAWGIWHLPVILMGHNYPHYPYLGIIMMTVFTIAISPLFTYVRMKTRSILGACMLHGMINASSALFLFYVVKGHELFSSIVGIAGILAAALMCIGIYVFDNNFIRSFNAGLQD